MKLLRVRSTNGWAWRIAALGALVVLIVGIMSASAQPAQPNSRTGGTDSGAQSEWLGQVIPFQTIPMRDAPRALPAAANAAGVDRAPRRTFPATAGEPAASNFTQDPLMGTFNPLATNADRVFTTPILNFDAQLFSGVNPSDNVGDVGLAHYVQAINGAGGSLITIYNKADGTVAVPQFELDEQTVSGLCDEGAGDPIILFDQYAQRWMWAEFSGVGNGLCVYISNTSDPTGSFSGYAFATSQFPDYPKFGVWSDAYWVTTNESAPAVYAMERDQMVLGLPADIIRVTAPPLGGFGFQALTPSDADGATLPPVGLPTVLMRHNDDEAHEPGSNNPAEDYIETFTATVDWGTNVLTLSAPSQIAVADFDSRLCDLFTFSCLGQPNGGVGLDPLREVIMHRLQYRNFDTYETWVGSFATDLTFEPGTTAEDQAGTRWFEIRASGSGLSLHQEGLIEGGDDVSRWMSSIALDGSGNLAVGYNVVDYDNTFPGMRYTGRLATDPLNVMTQGENSVIEGVASNASIRWGDYNSVNVDPVDECTFWFTSNYSPAAQWRTRLATFKFDECGAPPVTPTPSPTVTSTVTPGGPTLTPTETATTIPTATATPVIGQELIVNGSFENTLIDGKPDLLPWTAVTSGNDKIKCNKAGKPDVALDGICAFRFKGEVAESSKVQQKFIPGVLDVFLPNDVLFLSAFVNAEAVPVGTLKVVVKYSDLTTKSKLSIELAQTVGYTELLGNVTIASGAVSQIKLSASHKTLSGKVYLDDVSLIWQLSGVRTRDAGLLPLPGN
ncbi:MAG: hypothetical protein H7Y11_03935 [Armatimonadetes bacterium]|nr:hypothetical protein [Anaerolineae bacterium]